MDTKSLSPEQPKLELPISVQLSLESWFWLWRGLERAHGQPRTGNDAEDAERDQQARMMDAIEAALLANGFQPRKEVIKMRGKSKTEHTDAG